MGVSYDRKRAGEGRYEWRASIIRNKRFYHIGYFDHRDDAEAAYQWVKAHGIIYVYEEPGLHLQINDDPSLFCGRINHARRKRELRDA